MLKNLKISRDGLLLPRRSFSLISCGNQTSAETILSLAFRFELLGSRTDASPESLLGLPFTLLSTVVYNERSLVPDKEIDVKSLGQMIYLCSYTSNLRSQYWSLCKTLNYLGFTKINSLKSFVTLSMT